MSPPKFPSTISLGNIITIMTVVVGLTGGWFTLSARVDSIDERSRANSGVLQRHSEQLSAAQASEARTEERLRGIETSLVRIEAGVADLTTYLRGVRP